MADKKRVQGKRFWAVYQHKEATVVEADQRPDTKVAKGEREKKVKGPYETRELAQRAADAGYFGARSATKA